MSISNRLNRFFQEELEISFADSCCDAKKISTSQINDLDAIESATEWITQDLKRNYKIKLRDNGKSEKITSGNILKEKLEAANIIDTQIAKIMTIANQRFTGAYNTHATTKLISNGIINLENHILKVSGNAKIQINLEGEKASVTIENIKAKVLPMGPEGIPDKNASPVAKAKIKGIYSLKNDTLVFSKQPSIISRIVSKIFNFFNCLFSLSK